MLTNMKDLNKALNVSRFKKDHLLKLILKIFKIMETLKPVSNFDKFKNMTNFKVNGNSIVF